jgi:hypothetical protein
MLFLHLLKGEQCGCVNYHTLDYVMKKHYSTREYSMESSGLMNPKDTMDILKSVNPVVAFPFQNLVSFSPAHGGPLPFPSFLL